MIPAGRTAIDQSGIAELHGLSIHQARRARPWAAPGHPAPLTRGKPRRGHPQLWDRDQAAAYAADPHGPIPDLPGTPHPDDLLDAAEAAELLGIATSTWTYYGLREQQRGQSGAAVLAPEPDAEVSGTPHWLRRTIEKHQRDRAHRANAPRGGRPAGARSGAPSGEIAARVAELLQQAAHDGETPSVAEVARRLGVHYTTALKHVQALRRNTPS